MKTNQKEQSSSFPQQHSQTLYWYFHNKHVSVVRELFQTSNLYKRLTLKYAGHFLWHTLHCSTCIRHMLTGQMLTGWCEALKALMSLGANIKFHICCFFNQNAWSTKRYGLIFFFFFKYLTQWLQVSWDNMLNAFLMSNMQLKETHFVKRSLRIRLQRLLLNPFI